MKANELRDKDDKALQDELLALTRERFNLRMQKGTGQLASSHRLRDVSRDIARVKTVISERKNNERKNKVEAA
jgi:large subunit ribosomal protein L29